MATISQTPVSPFSGLINDNNYQWWVALPVILGMFIVIMDSSIVNVALPHIMAAFGANVDDIEWVSTGYMLSSAITMPSTGFLSDRFGRKKIYVWAIFFFTIASMLCGAAWDNASLVFFRVLQGVVGGAIQPIGQAIIFEAFPPAKRGMAMALVGLGAMFAPMIGPTLGGYLVDYINWRWIFYVNLPFGLLATFMAMAVIRATPLKPVKFDSWGFYSMAIFLTTLLLGVSDGNKDGWDSNYIVGLFVVAAISFSIFLVVELWRSEPIIDLTLFKYSTYTIGTIVSIVVGIALFGGMFLLPLFLQNLMGYDAIQTGLLLMPQGMAVAVGMPIAGALVGRIDPRYLMVTGLSLLGYSLYLQASMTPDTSIPTLIGWTVMRGFAMALTFPAMNQTALGAVPIEKIGQASGLFNVTRQIGGSFGIAGLSMILTDRTIFHMATLGQSAGRTGQSSHVIASLTGPMLKHGANIFVAREQAAAIFGMLAGKQASVWAFQDAFYATAVLCLVGIVPALFMEKKQHASGEAASHAMVME